MGTDGYACSRSVNGKLRSSAIAISTPFTVSVGWVAHNNAVVLSMSSKVLLLLLLLLLLQLLPLLFLEGVPRCGFEPVRVEHKLYLALVEISKLVAVESFISMLSDSFQVQPMGWYPLDKYFQVGLQRGSCAKTGPTVLEILLICSAPIRKLVKPGSCQFPPVVEWY